MASGNPGAVQTRPKDGCPRRPAR